MKLNREELERKYDLSHNPGPFNTNNPVVEQIEAAMRPEFDDEGNPRTYSPHARLHPEVSAALDVALSEPTTLPDVEWLKGHAKLDFDRSNLPGRRVGGPRTAEDALEWSHAEVLRELFEDGLEAATTGPYGIRTVVLIDPNVPAYQPNLPKQCRRDGVAILTRVRFPVSYGYSTLRVARRVAHLFASQCYWCAEKRTSRRPDWGMVVSAGAAAYVFPTCGSCRSRLARALAPDRVSDEALLTYIENYGWEASEGWPSDDNS
jgi:hypothetical protein